jgi:hypothetical protein
MLITSPRLNIHEDIKKIALCGKVSCYRIGGQSVSSPQGKIKDVRAAISDMSDRGLVDHRWLVGWYDPHNNPSTKLN